ncbi:MAG: (2Fe-2S)-binding protein [Burkholderiales bacterium]|nr:(2Fe-2S)-binding protein [Burkholderiales bacterium]
MAWQRIEDGSDAVPVRLVVEGRPVQARAGDTVAAAMLAVGVAVFRETPVSGAPRAPLCMMGVCFDCLVEVDGRPNVQACMTPVAEGMQICLQHGARRPEGA